MITGKRPYTQLSGCVIATAAYGSELDPDVALLRRERDQAAQRSGLVELAALLYARAAPPLAQLVGRSDTARAAVRALLRPIMSGQPRGKRCASRRVGTRQAGSTMK